VASCKAAKRWEKGKIGGGAMAFLGQGRGTCQRNEQL